MTWPVGDGIAYSGGLTVGDLTVRLGDPDPHRGTWARASRSVTVLAEKSLLEVPAGTTLHESGPALRPSVRPERWIEFLGHHPARRG
jgi:hypothetical protein